MKYLRSVTKFKSNFFDGIRKALVKRNILVDLLWATSDLEGHPLFLSQAPQHTAPYSTQQEVSGRLTGTLLSSTGLL